MARRSHTSFFKARSGASAVEFALIVPVLCGALLGLVELGNILFQRTDMQSAVRSGAQYVMNGGRSLSVAQGITEMSWTTKPEDGLVEVTQFCLCSSSAHACNSPCADDSVPESYIQIHASATLGGVVVEHGEAVDDQIRIR